MAATQALTGSGGWPICRSSARPTDDPSTQGPTSLRWSGRGCPPSAASCRRWERGLADPTGRGPRAGGRAGYRGRARVAFGRNPEGRGCRRRSARTSRCPTLGRAVGGRHPRGGRIRRGRPRCRRAHRDGRRGAPRRVRSRVGRLRPGAEVPAPHARRAVPPSGPHRGPRGRRGAPHGAANARRRWRREGSYDHLVGGFCRYSTDARWLVPHFEKMLTDQALLARAYLHAWQEGGHSDDLVVVTETLDWVLRDLSTPEGALYSSFDADAGGVEGAHATFTLGELKEILPPELVEPAAQWYGITEAGNWEGRSHSPSARLVRTPCTGRPEIEEAAHVLLAAARMHPRPAGARREGPDRVERHGRRDAGRGRLGHRAPRVRPPGRGDRDVPVGVHVRRRAADAQLAGRAEAQHLAVRPTTPGSPRPTSACPNGRAARCETSALTAVRQLIGPLLGRGVRRFLHHRKRRRGTGGPAQGDSSTAPRCRRRTPSP